MKNTNEIGKHNGKKVICGFGWDVNIDENWLPTNDCAKMQEFVNDYSNANGAKSIKVNCLSDFINFLEDNTIQYKCITPGQEEAISFKPVTVDNFDGTINLADCFNR